MKGTNLIMKRTMDREYGNYIGANEWDLYLTFHYYNGCKAKGNRKLMERIHSHNNHIIERMFFVSERSANYQDVHSHILIKTSSISDIIKGIKPLNSICNIKQEGINNEIITEDGILKVGYYVSKFLSQGVDYDIF
jgi:hypothetical protein